jgi:hypothetical protein
MKPRMIKHVFPGQYPQPEDVEIRHIRFKENFCPFRPVYQQHTEALTLTENGGNMITFYPTGKIRAWSSVEGNWITLREAR